MGPFIILGKWNIYIYYMNKITRKKLVYSQCWKRNKFAFIIRTSCAVCEILLVNEHLWTWQWCKTLRLCLRDWMYTVSAVKQYIRHRCNIVIITITAVTIIIKIVQIDILGCKSMLWSLCLWTFLYVRVSKLLLIIIFAYPGAKIYTSQDNSV